MKKEDLKNIADIIKAVPVYQDAIQPAAKIIGQSLVTVAKAVDSALAPLKLLVWGYDKIEVFLNNKLAEKLKDIPEEKIVTPPAYLAGPAIEALRFSGNSEDLRELYANLLATSMNKDTSDKAHPGYVDIIKNLTPAEARLLKFFASETSIPLIDVNIKAESGHTSLITKYTLLNEYLNLEREFIIPVYITNLCRLGILEIPYGTYFVEDKQYEKIENCETINYTREEVKKLGKTIEIQRGILKLTNYGKDFIECVVRN